MKIENQNGLQNKNPEALLATLKLINKTISTEMEKMKNLQEEIAFSTVKIKGKVEDREEILRALSTVEVSKDY